MKRNCVAASFLCVLLVSQVAFSQFDLSRILNRIPQKGITEKEAGQGVKEALAKGVASAVLNLNRTDGFYGSQFYRMLLPPDSQKVESTLRRIGLGSQVDKAILAMNRGAEDAVGYATPIFTDAIKEMTLKDALGIVRGNKRAATDYFQQKTSQKLIAAFTPSVK
jgi:hypothetical protein